MDILNVILLSLFSLIALFILTKLMGYRQMSEMSMFDYINGITIGSIAAEMATSLEKDWWLPLTAMVVYALAAIVLSYISVKSMAARRVISGKPLILMDHDTIYEKNLLKGKIDLSEMLLQCRVNGYFNLSDLQTIILEPNGRMSFLPKSDKRPVIPEDMSMTPEQEFLVANVIIDGHIMEKNLQHAGKDIQWLNKQMHAQNISNLREFVNLLKRKLKNIAFFPFLSYTKNNDFNRKGRNMQKKNILISVIDGQGGGIGRQYISALTSVLPKDLPVTIRALGTNSLATSNMLKGGANDGATGENAIVLNAGRSDIIVGVVAIVVANAILGELTPTMAQAIGASNARRILIPFDSCNTRIAMLSNGPLQAFIDQAVRMTTDYIGELLQ